MTIHFSRRVALALAAVSGATVAKSLEAGAHGVCHSTPCANECDKCTRRHRCKPKTNGTLCGAGGTGFCIDGVCEPGNGTPYEGWAWNPPAQSAPTEIVLSNETRAYNLGSNEDAIFLGPTSGNTRTGRWQINGGRHVIIRGRGGKFKMPDNTPKYTTLAEAVAGDQSLNRLFYTKYPTGSVMLEDVYVTNPNNEEFDVHVHNQGSNETDVFWHNVRIDNHRGRFEGWHGDCFQTFNDGVPGPGGNGGVDGLFWEKVSIDTNYQAETTNVAPIVFFGGRMVDVIARSTTQPFWTGCPEFDLSNFYVDLQQGQDLEGDDCPMPGVTLGTHARYSTL